MTDTTPGAIDCFGLTDQGRVREANEDHFVIASMRKSVRIRHTSLTRPDLADRFGGPEAFLFAVADGVGGRPGGQLASGTTVETLVDYVNQASGCFHSLDVDQEDALLGRLEKTVLDAHERIKREHAGAGKAPATTLTLTMLVWPRAYIIHVGDSRAYYLRRGRLQQITRDQTVGEFMVNIGAWTEAQGAKAGGALTSAIGSSELTPSVGLIDLEPGDVVLLCTDGLTKHLPDDRIAAVLGRPAGAEAMCRELVAAALEAGGSDNVTTVVARMSDPAA